MKLTSTTSKIEKSNKFTIFYENYITLQFIIEIVHNKVFPAPISQSL